MILLVGSGSMALSYMDVLRALKKNITVVGRGEESAIKFERQTSQPVIQGGLQNYLASISTYPTHAIVSVGVEQLADSTAQLLCYGVKNILVEKPAGLNLNELIEIEKLAIQNQAQVFVAYNRRFYSSVIAAKKIIEKDGGVQSFHFEITERGHILETIYKLPVIKNNWFLANTTHVADLAFFLGGAPEILNSFKTGQTTWHERSAVFAGAGQSVNGALFTYTGNWQAPGGWGIEICTAHHKLIFKPLETLRLQTIASPELNEVKLDNQLDIQYKPGLYLQLQAFLNNEIENMCSIKEHLFLMKHYFDMAGYDHDQ